MSNADIQPIITPSTTGLAFSNPASQAIIDSFTQVIGELTSTMNKPVKNTPNNGYRKIAFRPSRDLGSTFKIFIKAKTI